MERERRKNRRKGEDERQAQKGTPVLSCSPEMTEHNPGACWEGPGRERGPLTPKVAPRATKAEWEEGWLLVLRVSWKEEKVLSACLC